MDNLNIDQLVKYVNIELNKGLSTAQIEKNMKVGKDTIRKKLNRNFYFYQDGQFIKRDQTPKIEPKELNTQKAVQTEKIEQNIKKVEQKEEKKVLNTQKGDLTEIEELLKYKDTLIEIAKSFKKSNKIKLDLNSIPNMSQEVLTRQMRVHKNALDEFDEFCKLYPNLSKQTLLSWAVLEFLNNHK